MNLLEEIAHLLRTEPMIRVADGYCVLDEESANKVATSLLPIIEKAVQAGLAHGRARIDTLSASEIVKKMCGG